MILLDGRISQGFWRLVYPLGRRPSGACEYVPEDDVASSAREVLRVLPEWIDGEFLQLCPGKVGILVTSQELRRRSSSHCSSVWSGYFPEGSFYDLGDGVLVSSPCFTFLQMAEVLGFYELIAYGDEICGRYAFDAREPRGIRQREISVTTVDRLACYLESARGCRGYKVAMRALPHIVDGSASPMETVDEMLLCLPYRYGGYGICKPVMNHRIELSDSQVRLAGRRYCRADICWPDCKLDIEHQGYYDHSSDDAFDSDRARVNALVTAGFEVMELTHGQVSDLRSFEEIALHVAAKLGKRLNKDKLGATDSRLALRRELFTWNRRGGMHVPTGS